MKERGQTKPECFHGNNEWGLMWWMYLIRMEVLVYYHWMIRILFLSHSSSEIYSLSGNLEHCLLGHYLQQNLYCTASYSCSQSGGCPCFLSSVLLAALKSSCPAGLQLDLCYVKGITAKYWYLWSLGVLKAQYLWMHSQTIFICLRAKLQNENWVFISFWFL